MFSAEELRWFELAKVYSTWSKDPSSKISAIAIDPDKRVLLSAGYNGFPRGIADTPERLNNRTEKLKLMVHSEMNMIMNATYNGVSLNSSKVFVYGLPVCSECAKGIIQVGVSEVLMMIDKEVSSHWKESFERTKSLFNEAGVKFRSNLIGEQHV